MALLDGLRSALGLSQSAVAGIRGEILAHPLALTTSALTDELAELFTEVPEESIESFTGEDGLALIDKAIRAFLDSPRASDPGNDLYEATLQHITERQKYPSLHWRAACSLELPKGSARSRFTACISPTLGSMTNLMRWNSLMDKKSMKLFPEG